jgi:hypothetical protein
MKINAKFRAIPHFVKGGAYSDPGYPAVGRGIQCSGDAGFRRRMRRRDTPTRRLKSRTIWAKRLLDN